MDAAPLPGAGPPSSTIQGTEDPPPFSLGAFGPPSGVTVTAATATAHFVVLGDTTGALLVYDVYGNHISTDETRHSTPITALHAQTRADVLASASAEGLVIATRLAGDGTGPLNKAQAILKTQTTSSPTQLRVDPNFGRARSGNRIAWVEDDGSVRVFVPGWLMDNRTEIKRPGSPHVRALAWCSNLLAFATDEAVHVYDMRNNTAVCLITAPHARTQALNMEPPTTPPSPPSPLSDTTREDRLEIPSNVDFEEIDARRAASAASNRASRGSRAYFVQGEFMPHAGDQNPTPSNASENGRGILPQWSKSVSLFMEEEEDTPASDGSSRTSTPPENASLVHVTWPLSSRTIRIGPHRSGAQFANSPREVTVVFRLERGDLPVSLPGALGIMGSETDAGEWADGGLFGTNAMDTARPFADLTLSPLLCALPFGRTDRIVLVGTAFHSLALHLVDESGRCVRSMALPHSALRDGELCMVPGGDPLVLILSHAIDSHDPDLRRAGSVGSVESEDTARLADTNVTTASALTVPEHVKWLLAHNRFSDALEIAQRAPGGSLRRAEVSVANIGDQFLESILQEGDFERLAQVLPNTITSTSPELGVRGKEKVMATRRNRWEMWLDEFRKSGCLAIVAKSIPTYEPRFETRLYDEVLLELADQRPVAMLEVLKTWPADVFSLTTVTRKVEFELERRKTKSEESDALREIRFMLYSLSGRHDETLILLLEERSQRVFEYIKSHHLYEAVRSKDTIEGLFDIDAKNTTELLVNAPETVLPPDAVVPILEEIANDFCMFQYLNAVFEVDIDRAPECHNKLLRLLVKHGAPGALMQFLKTSTHYDLDQALNAMGGTNGSEKGMLAHERVYVLAAMGDTNSALDILLVELNDTSAAIEFASDYGDKDLWERLIKHAEGDASTLAALLDSPAGGKVDPVRLIPLLKKDMRIPNLRDRLHRILVDAALERALREDATAALRYDAEHLLQELEDAITVPTTALSAT